MYLIPLSNIHYMHHIPSKLPSQDVHMGTSNPQIQLKFSIVHPQLEIIHKCTSKLIQVHTIIRQPLRDELDNVLRRSERVKDGEIASLAKRKTKRCQIVNTKQVSAPGVDEHNEDFS